MANYRISLSDARAPFFTSLMLNGYKNLPPKKLSATTYDAAFAEARRLAHDTPNCIAFNVMAKTNRGAIRPVHSDN